MQNNAPTYKQGMNSAETWRYIKAIGYPIIVLLFTMYTVSTFAQFGTKLIAPFAAVMWVIAVIEAIIFGSQRKNILNEVLAFIGIYDAALLGFRAAIKIVSNVSTEQLVASYNQTITLSQSSALPGYLQNALWITSVLTPLGYIAMQAKRIFQFRKKISKQRTFEQLRSYRQ